MLGISLTVLFSALAAFAVWSYYINPALKSNVKNDNNAMYYCRRGSGIYTSFNPRSGLQRTQH